MTSWIIIIILVAVLGVLYFSRRSARLKKEKRKDL